MSAELEVGEDASKQRDLENGHGVQLIGKRDLAGLVTEQVPARIGSGCSAHQGPA